MIARRALFAQCLLVGLALLASCASAARITAPEAPSAGPEARAAYPRALFAVISDPHVYDPSLGLSGEAFERATAGSRILYGPSAELLHEAISEVLALKPDFLILPGDLTKDGEPSSHEIVLRELSRLSERGVDAYVIPGNHDIENPRAMRFADGKAVALEGVSVEGFSRLYASFGYEKALSRDPRSLSYVAQLVPGLRLLALDSFRYPALPDPKSPEPESLFPAETMAWIRSCLEDADREGERVIAMTHMSLLEHFAGQEKYFPESFPRGREALVALLESHGVRLVFTGHFHIQDIAGARAPGGAELYDVATGSLASYPLAYRVVELGADDAGGGPIVSIRSPRVASIPSMPEGLQDYAKSFLGDRVFAILERKLGEYLVPAAEAEAIARRYAEAYLALSAGDESPAPGEDAFPSGIQSLPGHLAASRYSELLSSLWRDLPPADNDLNLSLGP